MPYGPPLKSAPWGSVGGFGTALGLGSPGAGGNPVVPPSPPAPPLPPGVPSMNKPFLSRARDARARQRFVDVTSNILNTLLAKGYIVETSTDSFEIRVPPTGGGLTGTSP